MYNGEMRDQMHAAISLAALQEIQEYIKPRRSKWKCDWYKSREDFCLYEDLMRDLESEDPTLIQKFLRVPREMFMELLERLTPR